MTFHYIPTRDSGDDTDARQEQSAQRARRRRCPECSGSVAQHVSGCPEAIGENEAEEVSHG